MTEWAKRRGCARTEGGGRRRADRATPVRGVGHQARENVRGRRSAAQVVQQRAESALGLVPCHNEFAEHRLVGNLVNTPHKPHSTPKPKGAETKKSR